jgi:dTDP-glucose 4,6-dehydratase
MSNRSWFPSRTVVLGGAGFVGSHLCERLLVEGSHVVAVDNLITGRRSNVAHLRADDRFELIEADVSTPFDVDGPVDAVMHLASPASPLHYLAFPTQTLRAGSLGMFHAIDLASRKEARLLYASTSEVYGDPLVHPQQERYLGNVNPVGPRAVYDEAKRFGEAALSSATREGRVQGRIARIFNTVGPRMRRDDGRAVPAFATQAILREPITIHGDGSQTRSIADVDDTVEGLLRLLASTFTGPVNIGNPEEHTILEVARWAAEAAGVKPEFAYVPRMQDDPTVRCPDISRAIEVLGWRPRVPARRAVERAVTWFAEDLGHAARSAGHSARLQGSASLSK